MVPVDVVASKLADRGADPLKVVEVITAFKDVAVWLWTVKGNGVECGLSVPSLKAAVRVKLVVSLVSVTVQSNDIALALLV
jgi:hypothetical protein